jgi:hypothetical protein
MTRLATLIGRHPLREFELHRSYACDEKFREACDDYEDARTAQGYWKTSGGHPARALEYAELVADLEAEILARLELTLTARLTLTGRNRSRRAGTLI